MSQSQLQQTVSELQSPRGRGTEFVSVYVPPERVISEVTTKLTEEYGQASNIKSKRTRKNVQSALKSLKSRLKYYDHIPENGLALFSGAIEDDGGQISIETRIIDTLPTPLESFEYHCGSSFYTEPLEQMQESRPTYGLILLDRRDAHIGQLSGTNIEHLSHVASLVPGKHKAGGQSQQRFERLRLDAINEFYKDIANLVWTEFGEYRHDLDGILVGGPSPSKDEFIEQEYLQHELQSNIICVIDVSDTTERGLQELVNRGERYIDESELETERVHTEQFFTGLRDDTPVTYGLTEVEQAAQFGAIETLLLSTQCQNDHRDIANLVEEYGGTVVEISTEFEQGEQLLRAFDGIAAMLRYPLN